MKTVNIVNLLSSIGIAIMLTACSSAGTRMDEPADEQGRMSEVESLKVQLGEKESMLSQRERDLMEAEKEKQDAENKAMMAQQHSKALEMELANSEGALLPPSAKAGECYARVFVEPEYRTVAETVLKRAESSRFEIIPAKYETDTKQVLVSEASERLELVPATYEWVEEQVLVAPAKQQIVEIPARYKTVTEDVLVKPAHTVWKKGTGPIQKIDEATGEIMCLVEVPASYKTVNKTVLDAEATTKLIETPAIYKPMKKRVMKTPPTTQVVTIPAKYKTVEVTKLVSPEMKKEITIPAEYQTVTRQELLRPGHMEWRSILCETNMTIERISAIQRALMEKGYNPGKIDGVVGRETMAAVNAFQSDQGLPVDRYLNITTVKALGVSPR